MESLFRTGNQPPPSGQVPPRPENKRVWASLLKGKAAVIQEVAQETRCRDPEGIKTQVALTDGERALQILVEGTLGVTLVLDIARSGKTLEGCARLHTPKEGWRLNSGFWTAHLANPVAKSVGLSRGFARA